MSKAFVYDTIKEYESPDPTSLSRSAGWVIAVFRLGKPLTYSRKLKGSILDKSDIVSGAFERKQEPLIIEDDCIGLHISGSKTSPIKTLNATLKGETNYLSSDQILPGDWVAAWTHNNRKTTAEIIKKIKKNEPCNEFNSGLKFVGRVHSVRKTLQINPSFTKSTVYSLQCLGFDELNSYIFYDKALSSEQGKSAMSGSGVAWNLFMAEFNSNMIKLLYSVSSRPGEIKDNVAEIFTSVLDLIVGEGTSGGNTAINNVTGQFPGGLIKEGKIEDSSQGLRVAQTKKEGVPFAYIVPVSVAKILGKEVTEKSKMGVFSYADILETIVGVQQYVLETDSTENPAEGFSPILDYGKCQITSSRKFCKQTIRGTILPTRELNLINNPLWSILEGFKNPSLNEMYTAMKLTNSGRIMPVITFRQIPFSTESIAEHPGLPLTRFLSLPRWKIHPTMVRQLDVGRSNATRKNMIHVYGDSSMYENTRFMSLPYQMLKNPPIVDFMDVARSGIKPYMQTVSCALPDLMRLESSNPDKSDSGARVWMETIADWTMGSHLTLNGTIECVGIQSPVVEGDNIEFEGVAYHIEAVSINCEMAPNGDKSFRTTLSLSNGMPIDQSADYISDFPRYPGFSKTSEEIGLKTSNIDIANVQGDDLALTSQDPGRTVDR